MTRISRITADLINEPTAGDPPSMSEAKKKAGIIQIRRLLVPMDIHLRPLTKKDIPVFFRHQLDLEANAMVGIPYGDPTDRAKFDEKWSGILSDKSLTKRTIVATGEVAGYITCFLAPWSKRREIGYWIGKEFWGRGIATHAVSAFLKIVSERPLYATVAKHNLGSIRVLEKAEFVAFSVSVRADAQNEIEELIFKLE